MYLGQNATKIGTKASVSLFLCLCSFDTMNRTNGDNSEHFRKSLHEGIRGVALSCSHEK